MQCVFSRPQTDLFTVLQGFFPFDVRVAVQEAVMMMVPIRVSQVISKLAVANRRGFLAKVSACLIQSHGVERCEHPDVGQNGCIILIMAVTVR